MGGLKRTFWAAVLSVSFALVLSSASSPGSSPARFGRDVDGLGFGQASVATRTTEGGPEAREGPPEIPLQGEAPPETSITILGTAGAQGWYVSPPLVTLRATDDLNDVRATFFRIDDESFRQYSLPFTIEGDGARRVEYFSIDGNQNEEGVKVAQVLIDTKPPVFLHVEPKGIVPRADVALSWEVDDETSGVARFEVSVDGRAFSYQGSQSNLDLVLGDGPHVVRVRAVDVAGNTAEADIAFGVDTSPLSLAGPNRDLLIVLVFGLNGGGVVILLLRRRRWRERLLLR